MRTKTLAAIAGGAALILAVVWFLQGLPEPARDDPALAASLKNVVDEHRKVLVLTDGADQLDTARRGRSLTTAWKIFQHKHTVLDELTRQLTAQYREAAGARFRRSTSGVRQLVRFVSSEAGLRDVDRLAFLDLAEELDAVTQELTAAGRTRNPLAEPVKALRDRLETIHQAYREEVTRLFDSSGTRGAAPTRDKWDSDMQRLKSSIDREKLLAESGEDAPSEPEETTRGDGSAEIFGTDFAAKTVALTFDDGPHPRYTEQIVAILRKYGVRGCFFEIGSKLGTVQDAKQVKLLPAAQISKRVVDAGNVIANHTYSHPMLPKVPEPQRTAEIEKTNLLLEKILGRKPELFRAPYGARSKDVLQDVKTEGLRNVMWGVDSLDWADPIPESITLRVMRTLEKSPKGIILFHDIHKQSVMALPQVLEELRRQQYNFLTFQNGSFVKAEPPKPTERAVTEDAAAPSPTGEPRRKLYRESWALIVGINDYQQWPKLRYAVNDASAIEEMLVSRFGFKRENIRKLLNGDATRQRIMQALGDEFTSGNKVQREDRVLVFFAGHGATRTMPDSRQIGFIVPVDADRANYYSTAISMATLRDACDLIAAKHIYFIMDSCYSGLALTRGAGSFSQDRTYLEEVTRRVARQILTAGGSDQQVADDGPGGHSVFTWALLEGLRGKADLDGNGVISASELGAYISPVVASFSKQTPAMGNMVGSEGGEFLFELQPEPLTSLTQQFDGRAMRLNTQLASLDQQIAARQAELLRLQQSIRAETTKLTQLARAGTAPAKVVAPSKAGRAFDLDRQGQQLYRERKYDEALKKFQQAVDLKPGDAVLLNNLGFLYYRMGRYDDALAALQKTLAVDPKRREAHGNIADAYLKLGRKPEAKAAYEKYLALYPSSPRAAEVKKILANL